MPDAGGPGGLAPLRSRVVDDPANEDDVREVHGAIRLVASHFATRVVLCCLHAPESAAAEADLEARTAGVPLHLERSEHGDIELVVGPLQA